MGRQGGHQDHQGGGMMNSTDDPTPLRSITALRSDISDLMTRCGSQTGHDTVRGIFDRALSALLEIRVPRMPDTAEELQAMIEEGRNGPTFSTEEVFAHLDRTRRDFARFLKCYRADLAAGRWQRAAEALMPAPRGSGIVWEGGPYEMTIDGADAVIRDAGTGRTVSGRGCLPGTAALCAVLAAHLEWPEIWKR
jgi:hypothetical protein